MDNVTEKMINEVEKLNKKAGELFGLIRDADTILVDLIMDCDYQFSGFAQDIFNIWKESSDKKAVEQMFYEFTGMNFVHYLMKCKREIEKFLDEDKNKKGVLK